MTKVASLCLSILFAGTFMSTGIAQTAPAAGEPAAAASGLDRPSDGLSVAAMAARPCSPDVVFTRRLKYENDEASVLDVASPAPDEVGKRPIVMFFTADPMDRTLLPGDAVIGAAMCFAAEHGLLAVNVRYLDGPGRPPDEATKSAAAAISWVSENADLFRGNPQETVPIGFGRSAAPWWICCSTRSTLIIPISPG
jgi:hypothetical protein